MGHQISGSKIFQQVKSLLNECLNNTPSLRNSFKDKKVVIIQFERPPDLDNDYRIGQYNAAITSTAQKQKLFKEFFGCEFDNVVLKHDSSFEKCQETINSANQDKKVKAIIIQHPIPTPFNSDKQKALRIVDLIDPAKDIDAMNRREKEHNPEYPRCATSEAIVRVLESNIDSEDRVTVVGSDGFVGKDVVKYLELIGSDTNKIDLKNQQEISEINKRPPKAIVSAAGVANLLDERHLSPSNHIVVDCTFVEGGVDVEGKKILYGGIAKSAYDLPEFVTPVPGGIGPMEMAVLAERFIQQEYPELQLEPWKMKSLATMTAADLESRKYLTENSLRPKQEATSLEQPTAFTQASNPSPTAFTQASNRSSSSQPPKPNRKKNQGLSQ